MVSEVVQVLAFVSAVTGQLPSLSSPPPGWPFLPLPSRICPSLTYKCPPHYHESSPPDLNESSTTDYHDSLPDFHESTTHDSPESSTPDCHESSPPEPHDLHQSESANNGIFRQFLSHSRGIFTTLSDIVSSDEPSVSPSKSDATPSPPETITPDSPESRTPDCQECSRRTDYHESSPPELHESITPGLHQPESVNNGIFRQFLSHSRGIFTTLGDIVSSDEPSVPPSHGDAEPSPPQETGATGQDQVLPSVFLARGGWPTQQPVHHSSPPSSPPTEEGVVPLAGDGGEYQLVGADDGGAGSVLDVMHLEDLTTGPPPSPSRLGHFGQAAVAVDSIPCSGVGREILLKNGTAVDAAVAVLFCNGVVNLHSMGIGGGFLMTVFLANGTSLSLVATPMAPAAATVDMFANQELGHKRWADPSKLGPRAAGVPGEVLGYWEAKQRLGNPSVSWADLLEPAISMCEKGITVSRVLARAMKKDQIRADPGLRAVLFNEGKGRCHREGEKFKHPMLARTLRRIAELGPDEIYRGETGRMLVEDVKGAGGLMSLADLEKYKVSWETPMTADLPNTDGLKIVSSPPPGSGAVLAAILGISGGYASVPSDRRRPLAWHRFTEACKFAFAKRTFLADWRYGPVKEEVEQVIANLTSPNWQASVRELIDNIGAPQPPEFYGTRFYNEEDGGTSHISILSPSGDAVSVTSTVNLHFGSKYMSPSTGIVLNNMMDDFSYPNVTNHYGVPPSPNNFVHPGKRPTSSMSPTVVYDRDNRVVAVVGGSGGTKIITSVAQVLYRLLYLGQGVKEAVDSRRLHNQLYPDTNRYEVGTTKWLVSGLEHYGHKLERFPVGGATVQAIMVDRNTGDIMANADFRKNGTVDGI